MAIWESEDINGTYSFMQSLLSAFKSMLFKCAWKVSASLNEHNPSLSERLLEFLFVAKLFHSSFIPSSLKASSHLCCRSMPLNIYTPLFVNMFEAPFIPGPLKLQYSLLCWNMFLRQIYIQSSLSATSLNQLSHEEPLNPT